MPDPARAERLWLAIAIATWRLLAVGGEAEATLPTATFPAVPGSPRQQGRRWRLVGIFRHGGSLIVAALFNHQPLTYRPRLPRILARPVHPPDSPPLPVPVGET